MTCSDMAKEADVFDQNCGEFMEKLWRAGHDLMGDVGDGMVEDTDFLPTWENNSPAFLVHCSRCNLWYGLDDEDNAPSDVPACPCAKEASND